MEKKNIEKYGHVWKTYVKIGNKYGDDMENGRFIDDLANHLAIQKLNLMLFSESEMVLWIWNEIEKGSEVVKNVWICYFVLF